jgi:hypothetical protein
MVNSLGNCHGTVTDVTGEPDTSKGCITHAMASHVRDSSTVLANSQYWFAQD